MAEELIPQIGAHFLDGEDISRHEMHGPMVLPPGADGLSLALYQSVGVALEPGHQLELCENRRVFERVVEDIRRAQHSVHLMLYIWRPCRASDAIVAALVDRARAGVHCRVVVDPVGSEEVAGDKDFDQQVEKHLTAAGCEVHYYRLLRGRMLGRILGRNHQKLVVVDGRVGYTGGFGIWKVWDGSGLLPDEWRDTNVRIEGPAVRRLQVAFARAWQESGGALLPDSCFPAQPRQGAARCGYVESGGRLGITDAERMVRIAIAAARERLWITNAYFTPTNAILHQLCHKRQMGVDVRILGTGDNTDQPMVLASQRACYPELLAQGVRIWEYGPSMLHSKTILADDWLGVVGSTNLDSLSLNKLAEGSLVVADEQFARALEDDWEKDIRVSREVTLENGGRTNPWRRVARRMTQWAGKDR